jgi:cell division transport system permease protein
VFGQLAWVMGMLLFAGVVLMVSNTVRLAVYVRRDQLEVMDLVGASLNYIRLPFLAEAVMHGLIASLLASAVVLVLFLLLGGPMSLPLGLDLGNIFAFSWLVPPILAAVALAAALIGGFWGVGKALRAKVGS